LQDFSHRDFADQSLLYSSFAYRLDAIRVLGMVLSIGKDSYLCTQVVDVSDAALVSWGLNLPKIKRDIITLDGYFDEMLFQAHMIINM
jgi:hypothetical protein